MAGPDLPRPPIEDQLGSRVAGQQGDGVLRWSSCSIGGRGWLAEGIVETPNGSMPVMFMFGGTEDQEPLGPQVTSPSVGPKA